MNSNNLFCPQPASWPMPPSWEGDGCPFNTLMCQLALSLWTGRCVSQNEINPQLWTSSLWQGQAYASGHQAFYSLNLWPLHFLAALKITPIISSPVSIHGNKQHNRFLFYQKTNRNCMFGWISVSVFWLIVAWGNCHRHKSEDKAAIYFSVACAPSHDSCFGCHSCQGMKLATGGCGFEALFANSCSNLLCLNALNSSG